VDDCKKRYFCCALAALVTASSAFAAEPFCPVEAEPLPHLSWAEAEQVSSDELFTRARNGFRHWSRDADFQMRIYDSLAALVTREPDDPRGFVELARFAMIEGTVDRLVLSEEAYDLADRLLNHALRLDPEYAPGWALTGLFYLHRRGLDDLSGSTAIVESTLAKSERLDPAGSDIAFAWASYYELRGRYDLAIREMRRLLEREAISRQVAAAAYRRLGAYHRDAGEPRAAFAAAEEAIALERLDPRNLLLYSSLALEERGDADLAVAVARLAFCLEPTVAANQRLAYALYVSWAMDNLNDDDPSMNDDRLVEAVGRHANIADVVDYISAHERLAPLTQVLIRAGARVDTEDADTGVDLSIPSGSGDLAKQSGRARDLFLPEPFSRGA
jgi:tetratricopeptide (TPR) repeat protein